MKKKTKSIKRIRKFCKVCDRAFKKEQFCHHCKQIYLNAEIDSAIDDNKAWIECDCCKKWVIIIIFSYNELKLIKKFKIILLKIIILYKVTFRMRY